MFTGCMSDIDTYGHCVSSDLQHKLSYATPKERNSDISRRSALTQIPYFWPLSALNWSINDNHVWPTTYTVVFYGFFFLSLGVPFKRNFMSVAKTILKRLFRVYAHIYHQHFDSVMQLQEEAHLNTSFKHFIFFVQVKNLSHVWFWHS